MTKTKITRKSQILIIDGCAIDFFFSFAKEEKTLARQDVPFLRCMCHLNLLILPHVQFCWRYGYSKINSFALQITQILINVCNIKQWEPLIYYQFYTFDSFTDKIKFYFPNLTKWSMVWENDFLGMFLKACFQACFLF